MAHRNLFHLRAVVRRVIVAPTDRTRGRRGAIDEIAAGLSLSPERSGVCLFGWLRRLETVAFESAAGWRYADA